MAPNTMFYKQYIDILKKKHFRIVCSKSYGLELLLFLMHSTIDDADFGIQETYDRIKYNKPRKQAFIKFINNLEGRGYIYRQQSKLKKSRIVLRLEEEYLEELIHILDLNTIDYLQELIKKTE